MGRWIGCSDHILDDGRRCWKGLRFGPCYGYKRYDSHIATVLCVDCVKKLKYAGNIQAKGGKYGIV